jgi:hypothetical protein
MNGTKLEFRKKIRVFVQKKDTSAYDVDKGEVKKRIWGLTSTRENIVKHRNEP